MKRKPLTVPDREPDLLRDELQRGGDLWKIWWKEKIFMYRSSSYMPEVLCLHRLIRKNNLSYFVDQDRAGKEIKLGRRFQAAYKQWRDDQIIERILLK